MVEGTVELVDRVRTEGVADLGAVEGDAHTADVLAGGGVDGPVVSDIGEVEAGDFTPGSGVEDF